MAAKLQSIPAEDRAYWQGVVAARSPQAAARIRIDFLDSAAVRSVVIRILLPALLRTTDTTIARSRSTGATCWLLRPIRRALHRSPGPLSPTILPPASVWEAFERIRITRASSVGQGESSVVCLANQLFATTDTGRTGDAENWLRSHRNSRRVASANGAVERPD